MITDLLTRGARALRAAVRPDAAQERLQELAERLRDSTAWQRAAARHHEEALNRVAERAVQAPTAADLAELRKEVAELRRSVGLHARTTMRALRLADRLSAHAEMQRRLEQRIRAAGRTDGMLAGPWTGEVGFELLYWIPFLRRVARQLPAGVPMTVLGRGGSAEWYRDFAPRNADVLDTVSVGALRAATSGESRKQRDFGAFDRRLLAAARTSAGLRRPTVIHPSLLYGLLYPYWKDQLPAQAVFEQLEFRRLDPPADAGVPALPARFVAVRFYFSACFADTSENRAFVSQVVRQLAQHTPVVMLETPFSIDDHRDADADALPVIRIRSELEPRTNLAVQSAVIARAQAFVGTYGGFSYLAPFYDVPSVAFYSKETFFPHHLDVARRAFSALGVRGLSVIDVREASTVAIALGDVSLNR